MYKAFKFHPLYDRRLLDVDKTLKRKFKNGITPTIAAFNLVPEVRHYQLSLLVFHDPLFHQRSTS
jgi:hypothetical protein